MPAVDLLKLDVYKNIVSKNPEWAGISKKEKLTLISQLNKYFESIGDYAKCKVLQDVKATL